MATIKVKTLDGKDSGSLDLSDAVFGVPANEQCIRSALNQFLANRRAGTHSTKTRGDVRGGGRKPYRQKGTGRARQGSIRAVQWKGGAVAFGPHKRDYSFHVNRKVKRAAIRSALSELARTERLIAIEEFGIKEPRTKRMAEILKSLEVEGKALLIDDKPDRAVVLSTRNLPGVHCIAADSPNIYDLITHDYVVATKAALKRLEEAYA